MVNIFKSSIRKNLIFFLFLLFPVIHLWAQNPKQKITKSDIEGQFSEGLVFYLKGDFQEALLIWESLLSEKVEDPGLYYYMSKANAILKNESNAILYAEKAHQLRPASLDYGLFYVDLLLKKRKFQEAIEVLYKIAAFDESQPEVNIRLAQSYLLLENGDEAIKALNKSDHYIGDFPVIIRTKQFIFLKQRKWKEFQEASLHFLENFPEENLMEWELLEMLPLEEANQYEPLLDSIAINYPDVQQINFIKAINRFKENKWKESCQFIQQTLMDERVEPDILAVFFEDFHKMLTKNKDSFDLAPTVGKALQIYPKSSELAFVLGEISIGQEKPEVAKMAFQKAVENGSNRFEAFAELVQLDMYFEQLDSALIHVDLALQKFPSNGFLYFQKGFVLSFKNQTNEAIAILLAGLPFADKRFDYYVRIQSLLGDLYHKIGKNLESDEAFEKALEVDPKDDHVLNNYSYFLSLRKDNLEKALKMSAQLLELLPDMESYLDTHGWVWFQMGNYEKALPFIQKAFDKSLDPSAEIMEHLGDVKFKLGFKKDAIQLWKKAFEKNKENKLLEKKIQKKDYFEN
jgi:tetratricopeptide (TPR) repeat protein